MDTPMPEAVKKIVVMNVNEIEKVASSVICLSAVDMSKEEIKVIEEAYAKTDSGSVQQCSQMDSGCSYVKPEINPNILKSLNSRKRLGTTRDLLQ